MTILFGIGQAAATTPPVIPGEARPAPRKGDPGSWYRHGGAHLDRSYASFADAQDLRTPSHSAIARARRGWQFFADQPTVLR